MPGGPSSTTCGPIARPRSPDPVARTPELLLVFKAARRQEYLQQNLRILSAARGETVETTYGLRWQSAGVRAQAPEPGEEALILFTSRPYRDFIPARFARVVRCERVEEALRLHLELGSRATSLDSAALRDFILGGPNPSEASEVWLCRPGDPQGPRVRPLAGESVREPDRPPVAYAEPPEDERAWRATIDQLAPDDDYAAAVFLRVDSVRPAEDGAARPLEAPYRFRADRAYLVRVASYNPHLPTERLRAARLVTLYDELATAVVAEAIEGIPADGTIDVLVSPIVGGPGWLELDVALGMTLLPAATLGWTAEAPPMEPAVRAPRRAEQLPLELTPADPMAEAAVRAYAVAEAGNLAPDVRLRLLEELRVIAPVEPRLVESEAAMRYELDDPAAARELLSGLPLDTLGVRGRALLVAATLRTGRLPEPFERIRVADLSRPDAFRLVLEATAALTPDDQVHLSGFVVRRLLSEDRAHEWLAVVARRPLPDGHLRRLRELSADRAPDEENDR